MFVTLSLSSVVSLLQSEYYLEMVTRSTSTVSSTSYTDVRLIGVDGSGSITLDALNKDMTVIELKQAVASILQRPAHTWEDIHLYHLGVVMRNGIFPPFLCLLHGQIEVFYFSPEVTINTSAPHRLQIPATLGKIVRGECRTTFSRIV